jgi:hypothetical protein
MRLTGYWISITTGNFVINLPADPGAAAVAAVAATATLRAGT